MTESRTFFALDFDRCLADLDQLYGMLVVVVQDLGFMTSHELGEARQAVETNGGSFDVMDYLESKLTTDQLNKLVDTYLSYSIDEPDRFLNPGARQLLDWLDESKLDHGIVTYGGTLWQSLKIKRTGLSDITRYVVDNPDKATLIASWYDAMNSGYKLPTALSLGDRYQSIVLVDDKARAFNGLDDSPNARGYWLQGSELLASQQGSVPENVRIIKSLDEVVNYERLLLT